MEKKKFYTENNILFIFAGILKSPSYEYHIAPVAIFCNYYPFNLIIYWNTQSINRLIIT